MYTRIGLPLAVAALWAAPAVGQDIAAVARRVDSLFERYDRSGSPGLALAVVRDGKVVLERGYGFANLEHNVRITPSTVFDVASVSKQFAGVAIAMLVDQGRIRLTDDVRRYIPELHDFGQTITIDHLLHHTSGLRDWPGTLAVSGWRFDDVMSFDQILRMAYRQRTLNFPPGSEYMYSNTGYNLLAEVVARVSGKSFRAWTDEHLFRPLGMASSHFHDDHTMVVPNRAQGYARAGAEFRMATDNLTALGSSSLFSTVGDLAKWVLNFENPVVGGRRVLDLTRVRGVLNDGSTIPYAFGVTHGTFRGLPTVSHSGSWAAFSTFLLHFPEQRTGVVVLANTNAVNAAAAAHDVAALVLEGRLAATTPSPTLAAAPGASVPDSILDRYAGVYRLGPGWYASIRRDGHTLMTRATREAEFPLAPRSTVSFWVPGYNASMEFRRDTVSGAITLAFRGRTVPRATAEPPRTPSSQLAGEYYSDELQTAYVVESHGDSLVLRHHRHGTIPLHHAWGDDYRGGTWFLRSVDFQRDTSGRVTGFLVYVDDRSRNIHFTRRP